MSTDANDGQLYSIYRSRIGRPTTDDEVRGYWVFLVGLILGVLGFVLFLPSQSAAGASGLTLRELSIVLAAVGLAMLIAGFVIRLPLQSWANYTAYVGQVVCLLAALWFVTVFPADWSVQTGNQPVILLYAVGLAIIAVGGVLAPLLVGATREDLEEREGQIAELRSQLEDVRRERDELDEELESAREDAATSDTERTDLREDNEQLRAELESLRTSQAQFELYEDRGSQYRWRLRHRNGNIIADSGQGYTRKHNAKKGMASVKRNALGGAVIHVEPDADEDPEQALEEAPLLPEAVEESKAAFDLYEDEAGEYRWRLVHDNGNIIADSGEGYSTKRGARNAVESVKKNVDPADYLRFDPTSFEIYRDAGGEWRWRLVHKNGNIIAAATEGYTRRRSAKRSVENVRELAAEGEGFEVYEDNAGEHRWRLRSGNNEIVATSGEGYSSEAEADDAVARIQEYAPEADALDMGFAAFEVYEDAAEEWRWRLRHRNGNILADSGEGYSRRGDAHDGIQSVKTNAPGADLTED